MNLTEFFNQQKKKEELEMDFPFQEFQGEKILNDPKLQLIITGKEKGKVSLEGKAKLAFCLPCDRCLKPVSWEMDLEFEREVLAPELVIDEDQKEDQYYMNGYELELSALIKEEMLMTWPSKVLCSQECKGICKKCGQNLNEGSCQCDDFVPDVRFANLMDIFKQSQE